MTYSVAASLNKGFFKMKKDEFLKAILNAASPAGKEDEVRFILNKYLAEKADRFYTDVFGSSYAVINEDAPFKVMITGHQDEIGFQITHIDDNGFLYLRMNGYPDLRRWSGSEVEVITNDGRHVPGILLNEWTDETSASDSKNTVFSISKMYVDLGVNSRKEALKLVSVGDYVVTRPNMKYLAGKRLVSKALDDKIGVYVAAEAFLAIAAKKPKNIGVYFVGASQEEVGSRGGRVAVQAIKPSVGFAVDVTRVSDFPGGSCRDVSDVSLGNGVAVFRNANNTPKLLDRILKVANTKKITHQLSPHYQSVSWTDASVIQVTDGGIATALFGIPNRYMHAQVEMVDMNDVDAAIKLIAETVLSFKPNEDFLPSVK